MCAERGTHAHERRRQMPRLHRHMHLLHGLGAQRPVTCEKSHNFFYFFAPKACDFSPSLGGNYPYQYCLPHL